MSWKTFIVVVGGLFVGCAGPAIEDQQPTACFGRVGAA